LKTFSRSLPTEAYIDAKRASLDKKNYTEKMSIIKFLLKFYYNFNSRPKPWQIYFEIKCWPVNRGVFKRLDEQKSS